MKLPLARSTAPTRPPLLPTILGGITLVMVITQVLSWTAFTDALYMYQVGPEVIIPTFAIGFIMLELLASILGWPSIGRRGRRRAAVVLLLVWLIWSALVAGALTRGITLGNLGFFGGLPPVPAFVGMLFIPGFFLAATMIVLVQLRRPLV